MSATKQKKKQKREHYLKIPNHILNLRQIRPAEKLLLAHFYSFGGRGCWQSNATLAKLFMRSGDTISRWIADLKKAGLISIKYPRDLKRTIWAVSHPQVRAAQRAAALAGSGRNAEDPRQKRVIKCGKNAVQDRHECGTTNNNTIKETTEETTATPSPLPAVGQASALPAERGTDAAAKIAAFKKRLGRKPYKQMNSAEFEERRRQVLKDLQQSRDVEERR